MLSHCISTIEHLRHYFLYVWLLWKVFSSGFLFCLHTEIILIKQDCCNVFYSIILWTRSPNFIRINQIGISFLWIFWFIIYSINAFIPGLRPTYLPVCFSSIHLYNLHFFLSASFRVWDFWILAISMGSIYGHTLGPMVLMLWKSL